MIEQVFSERVVHRMRGSWLGKEAFDELVADLLQQGYARTTIQQYVQSVEHFDGWLRRTGCEPTDLDETLVAKFLRHHLPRCRCPRPRATTLHQVRTALRLLLAALRRKGRLAPGIALESESEKTIREFCVHLRDTQGLALATQASSAQFVREFLAENSRGGVFDAKRIDAHAVVRFFAARGDRWSPGSMNIAASSLRRFFRYLELTGRADGRAVQWVPSIAKWSLASIPNILTDAQLKALIASFDRSTAVGLRGYATTICLAHLGLRACEVSALTLDDINWRAGTIRIPATKTRRADVLPLPAIVARAILRYLKHGRPALKTRQIFVRHATPCGTTGPRIIRTAVRLAGARIGLAPGLACPNALRHTMATRLLRAGASMKDVADVLRHRSIDTAAIYAKVDIGSLRGVAAEWPRRLS
jgi:integrase/recombinase XerD